MIRKTNFKKLHFILLVILVSNMSFAQKKNFKTGIYKSFNDFKNNIPSDTITNFNVKTGNDTLSHRFYRGIDNKRLKKEFAFCDSTGLYLSLKKVIKLFSKEDKNQLKDDGNYHIKAIQVGQRYIYFEDYFTSKSAAIFGGLIGGSAARRLKPIIYDREKQVFNLFKNAEDFESFLKKEHSNYLSWLELEDKGNRKNKKRKKTIENKELIRKIIFDINSEN